MMMPIYPASHVQPVTRPVHPHGRRAFSVCHLVDEHGKEIQITEAMIMSACEALRRRCHLPQKS
jgi:hypothetical protein